MSIYKKYITKIAVDAVIPSFTLHYVVDDAINNINPVRPFQMDNPRDEVRSYIIASTEKGPDDAPVYFRDELDDLIDIIIYAYHDENIKDKTEEELGFTWDVGY